MNVQTMNWIDNSNNGSYKQKNKKNKYESKEQEKSIEYKSVLNELKTNIVCKLLQKQELGVYSDNNVLHGKNEISGSRYHTHHVCMYVCIFYS